MTEHRSPSNHLPRHLRIKDGRVFETSNKRKDVIYLRCQTQHCRGTAKIVGNNEIVLAHPHSAICFSDDLCQLKADFRHALKSALRKNYWKLKVLYDTVVLLFPPEIKVEVPYNTIKNSLKEWRKSIYPPNPTGLEEMAFQLAQPENSRLTEYDVGRLVCSQITDSLGKIHLLFYDPAFVELAFRNVSRIFIDATFQTTPNLQDVYQLLTILGVTYDHALPFAHVLMSSKTEVAYTAVLNEISKLITSNSVKIVMTDFEQALRNASKRVFTSAHVTGCNVHYDRALLKQVKKLRLNNLVREDGAAKTFVRKLMALAFLPENMILVEYQTLINALSPALTTAFRDFIHYYERQWLMIVKPAGFCVHGLSRRTNNVTESYNSVLADELGSHPSAWTFLAWKQLYRGDISSDEFLDKAMMLKGRIRQRLALIVNNVSDEHVELDEVAQNIPADEDPDYDREIFGDVRHDEEELSQSDNHESEANDTDVAIEARHNHVFESENAAHSPVVSETEEEENIVDDEEEQVLAPATRAVNVDLENSVDEIDDADQINGPHYLMNNEYDAIQRTVRQNLERGLEADVQELSSDEESIVHISDDTDSDAIEIIELENVNNPIVAVASTSATATQPSSAAPVSRSRKKNLRKKRKRQMKDGNVDSRPRGHKRRGKKSKKATRCVVCLMNDVTHIFIPCGHNCCCETCAGILINRVNSTCPKCRCRIKLINRVYVER